MILHAVFFYLRYGVSYWDLEETKAERGVDHDNTTLNRCVGRYAGLIAETARYEKRPADRSWRMDVTFLKVRGGRVSLYRAIEKHGKILDFILSERWNNAAATKFFARTLAVNRLPRKIAIDKSGAKTTGIKAINKMLKSFGWGLLRLGADPHLRRIGARPSPKCSTQLGKFAICTIQLSAGTNSRLPVIPQVNPETL